MKSFPTEQWRRIVRAIPFMRDGEVLVVPENSAMKSRRHRTRQQEGSHPLPIQQPSVGGIMGCFHRLWRRNTPRGHVPEVETPSSIPHNFAVVLLLRSEPISPSQLKSISRPNTIVIKLPPGLLKKHRSFEVRPASLTYRRKAS
jgi:hypothetical protein